MIAVAPPPVELPTNTIAIVADVRAGHGVRISKSDFHHALAQAAAQKGRKIPPKRGGNGFAKLEETAVGELLDAVWIKGQAAEMGIGIRRREVRRELAAIKREAFNSAAEYRRFLRESHYPRRDVVERVEVQVLSTKIVTRVLAGISGKAAWHKALQEFVTEYRQRWRARTTCAPGYVIERCSNS